MAAYNDVYSALADGAVLFMPDSGWSEFTDLEGVPVPEDRRVHHKTASTLLERCEVIVRTVTGGALVFAPQREGVDAICAEFNRRARWNLGKQAALKVAAMAVDAQWLAAETGDEDSRKAARLDAAWAAETPVEDWVTAFVEVADDGVATLSVPSSLSACLDKIEQASHEE